MQLLSKLPFFVILGYRVETSYVAVEPKRRRLATPTSQSGSPTEATAQHPLTSPHTPPPFDTAQSRMGKGSAGRELRRARIVITVKRTETYKKWLEENPLQADVAGDDEDDEGDAAAVAAINVEHTHTKDQ